MREDRRKGEQRKCAWTQIRRRGVFSSSVEYHTRLSSRGVENPVVRAGLGSQMRLVILQLSSLVCPIRK